MVFCRADVPVVKSVVEVFKDFGRTSRLVMNPTKSMIYLGGVREETKTEILCITNMVEGSLAMKYLGIPLHQIVDYRPLLHTLQRKVNNWATRKLTFARRRMLI